MLRGCRVRIEDGWDLVSRLLVLGVGLTIVLVHRRWSGVGVIGREGTMVLWSCYGTSVTGAERG